MTSRSERIRRRDATKKALQQQAAAKRAATDAQRKQAEAKRAEAAAKKAKSLSVKKQKVAASKKKQAKKAKSVAAQKERKFKQVYGAYKPKSMNSRYGQIASAAAKLGKIYYTGCARDMRKKHGKKSTCIVNPRAGKSGTRRQVRVHPRPVGRTGNTAMRLALDNGYPLASIAGVSQSVASSILGASASKHGQARVLRVMKNTGAKQTAAIKALGKQYEAKRKLLKEQAKLIAQAKALKKQK
jgi:hypothetical protein